MELSLKQSPSMDGNQDPMQAQMQLQQRQLEQQQALEKADLTKIGQQIDSKIGNTLGNHSPDEQKILKKELAKEAFKLGGENANIRQVVVSPVDGSLKAQVGEFGRASVDPKQALNQSQAPSKSNTDLTQAQTELTQSRSVSAAITPEQDHSKALSQIDAKVDHKLDQYSPQEQQILKEALAKEAVKVCGEDAKIRQIVISPADGSLKAQVGEFGRASIDPRGTLDQAYKEQASLVREQAAQELAQQNPEQAALEKHVNERYGHYMAPIQEEMKSLNAIRADYENFAALPETEQSALNKRMSELNSQRNTLYDVSDLPIQEQADYFTQRDQIESVSNGIEEPQAVPSQDQSVDQPTPSEPLITATELHNESAPIEQTEVTPTDTDHENVIQPDQDSTQHNEPIPDHTITEEDLKHSANQDIEPVLESPPLDVPPLSPDDMTVSDAEIARLNADLNTISEEGAAVNAANTDAHATSEAKELTDINQAIDQMQDSSDKSTWKNVEAASLQNASTADQGIESVIESPPPDTPNLSPEELIVSDAEMARLNVDLNAIHQEGDTVNSANTETQAASEAKELTDINQTMVQMEESSQKSTWENVKETTSKVTDATLDVAYEQYANARAGLETVTSGATGFYSKIAGGIAGASYAVQGDFDRANEVLKETQKMYTYEPTEFTKEHLAPITEPVNDFIDEVRQSAIDYYGQERAEHLFTALELATDLLGVAGMKHGLTGMRNAEYTAKFNQLPHNPNIAEHLKNVDGFNKDSGIKGGHNRDSLLQGLKDNNLQLVSENKPVKGISEIRYGRDKIDGRGNPDGFKEYKIPKTVYDPKIHSDKQIFQMGKEAAVNGYDNAIKNGIDQYNQNIKGIDFRVYLDQKTKEITNFHPKY